MTISTLRPNGVGPSGVNFCTIVGAASAQAALSDDSDSSYVSMPTSPQANFDVTMTDVTLPGGAIMLDGALRARISVPGAPPNFASYLADVWLNVTDKAITATGTFTSATILTVSLGTSYPFTVAQINGCDVQMYSLSAGGSSTMRVYEVYLDARYVVKPVVAVNSPTGTITTTNQPLVSWTDTLDSDGGAQTRWTVKIFSAAQYGAGGFDPETSTPTAVESGDNTALSRTLATPLPNATYRAYVKVEQTVNGAQHASAWAFSGFIVNVTAPAAPVVTAAAQGDGWVKLIATAGDALSIDIYEIERSTNGGATWLPLRHAAAIGGLSIRVTGATLTVFDFEAPIATALLYRVRSGHSYSGLYALSAYTQISVTINGKRWWLVDPRQPSLNRRVMLRRYGSVQRAARQGTFQGLGASLPIVVFDTRAGPTGTLTLRVDTRTESDALTTLIATGGPYLLHGPSADGEPDRFIVFADSDLAKLVDNAGFAWRDLTLPWIEVARPPGPVPADWSTFTAPSSP